MKTAQTNCIILGHKNIGEADKMIFLYSEDFGKMKTIAKGARKITSKFTGHLETLTHCKVSLYFGPRNTIIREISINKKLVNEEDLTKLTNALKIAEIINKAIYEDQKIEGLHNLIIETLSQLKHTNRPNLIKTAFTIKLYDKTGYMPTFKKSPKINTLKDKPFHEIEKLEFSQNEIKEINKVINYLDNI